MSPFPTRRNRTITIARTEYLINNFDECIEHFNILNDTLFDGPSFYFHNKCIREYPTLQHKINHPNRNIFLECVYATLASWGMHRMGDSDTRLVNFNHFKDTIYHTNVQNPANPLIELDEVHIVGIPLSITNNNVTYVDFDNNNDFPAVAIINLVSNLQVSQSNSHLVANSKVLHHFLPNLFVPIDRQYTLKFFGINGYRLNTEEHPNGTHEVFSYLYPYIVYIAKKMEKIILGLVEENRDNPNSWHTSFTKVIDNAIIGAVKMGDYKEIN